MSILKLRNIFVTINDNKWNILFWLIITFGILMRTYKFVQIPLGLNGDEISAGYEALSLIETGKDRWGNHLPMYFVSWGSGQNVLYSYITAGFFYLFGSNDFVLRLPNLIFSLLNIPLGFLVLDKTTHNKNIAKIGAVILATDPYLILSGRWTMDVNFTPFVTLLAIYFLVNGLGNKTKIYQRLLIFPPLALLLYTYATTAFVIPFFLLIIILVYRRVLLKHIPTYLSSFLLFLILSFPFILFVLKNNYAIELENLERMQPFTITKLITLRVDLDETDFNEVFISNSSFIFGNYDDRWIHNTPIPFSGHIFLVSVISILALVNRILFWLVNLISGLKKSSRFKYLKEEFLESDKTINILYIWLISFVYLFLNVKLNANRFNSFIVIALLVTAVFSYKLFEIIKKGFGKKITSYYILISTVITIFIIQTIIFGNYYFTYYPRNHRYAFNQGFREMIIQANNERQDGERIIYTGQVAFSYLYISFYSNISPQDFQKSNWSQVGNGFEVYDIQNKYYNLDNNNLDNLKSEQDSLLFVIKDWEVPNVRGICKDYTRIDKVNEFVVERCYL